MKLDLSRKAAAFVASMSLSFLLVSTVFAAEPVVDIQGTGEPILKPCYPDEPYTVTLRGTLKEVTFPDPTEYERDPEGDKPAKYYVLFLDPPICTLGHQGTEQEKYDSADYPQTNVDRLELVFLEEAAYLYKSLHPYIDKQVECKGNLFDAETVHHYTPVLLQIFKRNCHPVSSEDRK